jgi:hypothetical protein
VAANDDWIGKSVHAWVVASVLALLLGVGVAEARIPRSSSAVAAFKRANPCPLNGAKRGACPGYEVDHVEPLCIGGPDTPENMQWLTHLEHRQKTRRDVLRCRRAKHGN